MSDVQEYKLLYSYIKTQRNKDKYVYKREETVISKRKNNKIDLPFFIVHQHFAGYLNL